MDNFTGKPISEFVKLAEKQDAQLIIVGLGNDEVKTAEIIAKVQSKGKVLVVPIGNLTAEDQEKLKAEMDKPKENTFERPPIPIINHRVDMPEIFIQDEKKPWEFSKKRKKLKGWQKKR